MNACTNMFVYIYLGSARQFERLASPGPSQGMVSATFSLIN